MAERGWYPDPGGSPGAFRYWDGAAWSAQTTTDPARAGIPSQPGGSGEDDNRPPWLVLLVALLVLALLAGGLVWWRSRDSLGLVAEDHNSSTPTISGWDERSSSPQPSDSQDPTDSGGRPVACPELGQVPSPSQPSGGRYSGGGLSFAEVPGWENSSGWGVDWADDVAGQRNPVVDSWVSIAVVGQVDKQFFPNPRTAVQQLASCNATSFYYRGISGREDLASESVTIDGHQGWHLRTKITVDGYAVEGDVMDIVAVDVGRPGHLAVFLSEAPIGDDARQQLVDAARASLRVEG